MLKETGQNPNVLRIRSETKVYKSRAKIEVLGRIK